MLRFWSRFIAGKAGFWWDDWFALGALVSLSPFSLLGLTIGFSRLYLKPFFWANCALSIYWVNIGLGKHISQVPQPHSQLALTLFIVNFVYITGLSMVKMSVLLFYVRVFGTVSAYRVIFWTVGILIVGWCVSINLLALLTCIPVQKAWLPTTPGSCLVTYRAFLGTSISNVVIDVIILIAPVPMLWRLHIETPRKFALIGVFAAGYW